MLTALVIAHILISFVLIVLVLIQDSKGDASGLMGGGSSKSFFGATGANTFLVKATRTVAALFAAGCLTLAYMTSQTAGTSEGVLDRVELPADGSPEKSPTPLSGAKASAPPEKTDENNPSKSKPNSDPDSRKE